MTSIPQGPQIPAVGQRNRIVELALPTPIADDAIPFCRILF
jgi:hypothetical protein